MGKEASMTAKFGQQLLLFNGNQGTVPGKVAVLVPVLLVNIHQVVPGTWYIVVNAWYCR